MPQKQLNDTFDLGSDYFSGYLSKTEITDIDQKYISSVIDLDSLSKISRQLTVSMGSMMSLVDGFAILMFVILIYLLSKIIIDTAVYGSGYLCKNVRSWIWHLPDRSFTGVPENKKSAYGRGTQKYRIIIQTHIYPDTALPVLHLSLI